MQSLKSIVLCFSAAIAAASSALADPIGLCRCSALAGNYPGVILFLDQGEHQTILQRFQSVVPPTDESLNVDLKLCQQKMDYLGHVAYCFPTEL